MSTRISDDAGEETVAEIRDAGGTAAYHHRRSGVWDRVMAVNLRLIAEFGSAAPR